MTTATANPTAPQIKQPSKFIQGREHADEGGAKVAIVATPRLCRLTPETKDELVAEFRRFIESINTPFIDALVAEVFTFHKSRHEAAPRRDIPSEELKAAFWARQRRRDAREAANK